ncbi:NAD(P)H-binding [Sinosporangium album]|uniref:NAD(P)H-binding n=1 Tax=Sinosporangium album TaxID=504805 RepID=A0A1G8G1U2_9ACTN|nr:NAD(P)H-binding protein [Sinosporangium album]SDH88325.1 NAD(P)H-binding [Sinosporangium album]
MTVLVTGATGNVGRHLVAQLLDAGHRVRALTRDPSKAALPPGAEVVGGNLTDAPGLARAFDGVTAAHLINFNGEDYSLLANGPEITDLAREAGVRRVTVLKGSPDKSPLEQAVEASGLAWTHLGPVEFMCNALEWTASVRDEGVVREAFPEARSAMVHEADIAAVAAAPPAPSSSGCASTRPPSEPDPADPADRVPLGDLWCRPPPRLPRGARTASPRTAPPTTPRSDCAQE